MMGGYGGIMGSYGNEFWVMGVLGILLQFIILIVVIYFIFHLIRITTQQQHSNQSSNALTILKERYAKGEVSDDEFKKIKDKLTK